MTPTLQPQPTTTSAPTSTPTAIPTATATPLPQDPYLEDLRPASSRIGFGRLGLGVYPFSTGAALQDLVIRAHGRIWSRGLFAHAPSQLTYRLDGQYTALRSYVVMAYPVELGDDCTDGAAFSILADGREIYRSPIQYNVSEPLSLEVDVRGVQELTLITEEVGHNGCDHTVWGDPQLFRGEVDFLPTATAVFLTSGPCTEADPEGVFLFLSCEDVQRIRRETSTGDPQVTRAWRDLQWSVDQYLLDFPQRFDPSSTAGILWWGPSNYIARDMGLAYLVTGNPDYAEGLLHLLQLVVANTPYRSRLSVYTAEAAPGLLSHPRYGAAVYQSLLFGYMAIRDSAMLDDRDRETYDAFFIHQAELLLERAQLEGLFSIDDWRNRNVPMGAALGAATLAAAFPDDPVAQTTYAQAREAVAERIAAWWELDGGWGEHTDWYGFRLLDEILTYAETVFRNGGEDLYRADWQGRSLGLLCRHFVEVLTPEGSTPAYNDSGFDFVDPGLLALCGQRTGDPTLVFAASEYRWGARHGYENESPLDYTLFHDVAWADSTSPLQAQAPDYTSVLLPSTGAAILRQDWSRDAQYLLLQFTDSLVHQDQSFGALYLYDHGPWLVGNGYHHFEASRQTPQHSTLGLGSESQVFTGGQVLAFADLEDAAVASVTSDSYPNLQHTRTVLWVEPWHAWLVVDDAGQVGSDPLPSLNLRWYVRGSVLSTEAGSWEFARSRDHRRLSIQMLPGAPAEYSTIRRSYDFEDWITRAVGVEMAIAEPAPASRLVTLLVSHESGTPPPLLERWDSSSATLARLSQQDETWDWLLGPPQAGVASVGGYVLSGFAGCAVREGGELAGYCLFSGTGLSDGLRPLIEAQESLSVEVDLRQGTITSEAAVPTVIRLYFPTVAATIRGPGLSRIAFTQEGDTLTLVLPAGPQRLFVR